MASQVSAVASLKITVANPDGKVRVVDVDRSPFQIGRRNDCELSLADNRISRTHAQILLEDGKYVLEDLESRHGTFVNGEKIARHDLRPGDRIAFGFDDGYHLLIGSPSDSAPRLMRKVEALPAPGATGNLGRLSAVLEVALALQSSRSVDDVLGAAVDAALSLTGAERGFLLLRSGGPDSELEVRVARNQNGEDLEKHELRIPRNVLKQALDRRLDLLSMTIDPLQDADTGSTDQTVLALNLRSVLCVPLVKIRMGREHETSMLSARSDTVGLLYMDSRRTGKDLADGNRELLQSLAIEISNVLENARLLGEEQKKNALEHELHIARDIQQSMLPNQLPQEGWLIAAGSSEACFQIGGDYFDVLRLSDDHWAAVLTDVSGKGVSAALLASLIQGAFFATASPGNDLPATVARISQYICDRSQVAKFATVFYARIQRDGATTWVNAGHCPALLARAGGSVEWLKPTSCPIGLFPTMEYPEQETRLAPGDKLILYSDGVSEAENMQDDQFGEERLEAVVARHAKSSPKEILDAVRAEVTAFTDGAPQKDDLTLLVLAYEG